LQVKVDWSKMVALPQMKDQWAVSILAPKSSRMGKQMWKTLKERESHDDVTSN